MYLLCIGFYSFKKYFLRACNMPDVMINKRGNVINDTQFLAQLASEKGRNMESFNII